MLLKLAAVPDGLTTIGNKAFEGCTNLTLTELPSSITEIGNNVFKDCTQITTLTFKGTPSSNGMSSWTFEDCPNLTTLNVPWSRGKVNWAPWGATNATINYNYVG